MRTVRTITVNHKENSRTGTRYAHFQTEKINYKWTFETRAVCVIIVIEKQTGNWTVNAGFWLNAGSLENDAGEKSWNRYAVSDTLDLIARD